ncbi:Purine nucleoside phosphorylase [Acidisarcina polymorpha]|uniref:Purine nucleoside phosphorylase n=1 Tax=Acidisarcina polymorpha TaxID=2211140 RepID=A0A2Z5G7C2_9BACT|nr:purine-nucleoside phosphorylase [Acidisarcina polymorpha]AXC14456.1 Purine nucleoside phosphorylase [Acidisarcina polymorpha]
MPSNIFEQSAVAADYIRSQLTGTVSLPATAGPKIAIILGSGLAAFAEKVEDRVVIPYTAIPHFPHPTVIGHSGMLFIGTLQGVPVAVMQGRAHFYEGYTAAEVTFPIRVLKQLGIDTLIVTNAAGGIRSGLKQGELVLLADHINLTGTNPLIGPNEPRFGERFFDMTEPYSTRLRKLAITAAEQIGFTPSEGVYLAVSGPSFETAAEIRAFRTLGADLVGMSTVHEVIVARHMGIEVLGISCVTNLAAGIQGKPLDHHEVLDTGLQVQGQLAEWITSLVNLVASQ